MKRRSRAIVHSDRRVATAVGRRHPGRPIPATPKMSVQESCTHGTLAPTRDPTIALVNWFVVVPEEGFEPSHPFE